MRKVCRTLIAIIVASTGVLPAAAAEPNPWMVRARAVHLDMKDMSEAIPSLSVPSNAIAVNSKWLPEVDVSYFFTRNVAAELILSYPQKHYVTVKQSALGGPTTIGTFKHLPPILSFQYHFNPEGRFRPYVGAGINLTIFMNDKLSVPGVGDLKLDSYSVGPAWGAGFDVEIAKDVFLNVDVKKTYIGSDVKLGGAKVSSVDVDPVLWGIGLGWRF